MIKTGVPGLLDGDGATEPDAAIYLEIAPSGQCEINDLEEILVPAHGDAVFGHPAEPRQQAFVQVLVQLPEIPDGPGRRGIAADQFRRQGFDFQRIDASDAEPFVGQVMGQRITRRPHADDQHIFAVVGQGVRAPDVQGIPARQQGIDLEAVRQEQDVRQNIGFNLRDVDRLRFLVDAGLHAVVADPVTRPRAHGIIDHDQRKRPDIVTLALEDVHFRDLFAERAAGEGYAQRVGPEIIPAPVAHPLGAGIRVPLVAVNAVIDFIQHLAPVKSAIGQGETVAPSQFGAWACPGRQRFMPAGFVGNQVLEIRLSGRLEARPA